MNRIKLSFFIILATLVSSASLSAQDVEIPLGYFSQDEGIVINITYPLGYGDGDLYLYNADTGDYVADIWMDGSNLYYSSDAYYGAWGDFNGDTDTGYWNVWSHDGGNYELHVWFPWAWSGVGFLGWDSYDTTIGNDSCYIDWY